MPAFPSSISVLGKLRNLIWNLKAFHVCKKKLINLDDRSRSVLFFSVLIYSVLFSNAMLCQICEDKESKYTCPKCSSRYCSLACFKSEKHVEMDNKSVIPEPVSTSVAASNSKLNLNSERQEDSVYDIQDPMLQKLILEPQFQEYISSPVLQFHILTVLEILNNVSLTNEYSKDGRLEIASRKLNNLREDGIESNDYVQEFICWLLNWMDEFKGNSV